MFRPLPRSWTSPLLSILRIFAGFLFIVHGREEPEPARHAGSVFVNRSRRLHCVR